jgi:hypothetical protein
MFVNCKYNKRGIDLQIFSHFKGLIMTASLSIKLLAESAEQTADC